MRGTVSKRIRRTIETGLGAETVLSLHMNGEYNRLYRRLKRGYTRGDVNAKMLSSYYGEVEKLRQQIEEPRGVAL